MSYVACYLREKLGELLKQVGAVEIAVVVEVELGDEARDPPQLYDRLEGDLAHLVRHLRRLGDHDIAQLNQEILKIKTLQLSSAITSKTDFSLDLTNKY